MVYLSENLCIFIVHIQVIEANTIKINIAWSMMTSVYCNQIT